MKRLEQEFWGEGQRDAVASMPKGEKRQGAAALTTHRGAAVSKRLGWAVMAPAAAVCLAACSSFSPNEWLQEKTAIDYRSERRLEKPLEVPPDLVNPARNDRFAIPEGRRGAVTLSQYQAQQAQGVERAPQVLPQPAGGMRVERAGNQRWLVVPASADALWPRLKDFWTQHGFTLALERPDLGVMETDWAENRAKIQDDIIRRTIGRVLDALYSTGERDKFRTRIEPGKNPGELEIYVSHRGMVEVYTSDAKDRTAWQPRPPDPELEAEMLRRLMVFLGAKEDEAKRAIAGAAAQDRAVLQVDAQRAELTVLDPFDRAYRRVGLALDRVGFVVEERNARAGQYRVRYEDPTLMGEEKSFWSRLAFWRKSDAPKPNSEYQIRVREVEAQRSRVEVLDANGNPEASPTARQILQMLFEELR